MVECMSDIKFSARSERGLRTRNDDAYCAEQVGDYFLFAVAGSPPGQPAGDIAGRTAIDALKTTVVNRSGSSRDTLITGVRNADAEVRALSLKSHEHAGLTTKLVACLLDTSMECTVLDTGEGNCIVVSGRTIEPARRFARLRKTPGSRHEEGAPPNPLLSDMISHVLGAPHRLKDLDFSEFFLGDGYLVLCSDGLTQVLKKEAIGIIIGKNDGNLETACEEMVNEAMTAGSESTVTVILVHGTV